MAGRVLVSPPLFMFGHPGIRALIPAINLHRKLLSAKAQVDRRPGTEMRVPRHGALRNLLRPHKEKNGADLQCKAAKRLGIADALAILALDVISHASTERVSTAASQSFLAA